jgi:protein-L-isoaspartate(D-aspartate) O-methyltransferase
MARKRASLAEIRRFFAQRMAAASGSSDPRLERVFELVPREAFLTPGPWHINVNGRYLETPSADPAFLYENALVALDAAKGINNGEPFLHAAWIGAVAPQGGETICHIGAGTGYYTAILSMLALPDGRVEAFEIEPALAERARASLAPFEGVTLTLGDATRLSLPPCDVIYVNAGVVAPPLAWLQALRMGGRMIFPWRPSAEAALAVVVSRTPAGLQVAPLMRAWFIRCVGASDAGIARRVPQVAEAWAARSLWSIAERMPDGSAVAVYGDIWFSSTPIGG